MPVRCEVWEGFIFVNLDHDADAADASTSASFGDGLEGYPFGEMTQVYKYRAEVGSNWKLFIDAFAEFYHAPILHAKQAVAEESEKLPGSASRRWPTTSTAPTRWCRRGAACRRRRTSSMVKPIERVLRSGLFGPWDRPTSRLDELPPGLNPARHQAWGIDSFVFFPNFMLLVWEPDWYLTYHYWPTAVQPHIFEGTLYFVPPKNARERLRQELAAVTFKEYALQDGNTLEATQTMIESRVVTEFPLNDQEILLRHLHKTAWDYVDEYKATLANGNGSARPVSAGRREGCTRMSKLARGVRRPRAVRRLGLPTEAERYAKRLDLDDGRDAGVLRRRLSRASRTIMAYLDARSRSTGMPDDAKALVHLGQSLVMVSFPVEVWRQPRVPDSGAPTSN